MEVQIISRDTIKPSSPTPHHSRTYNLCLFDPPTNYQLYTDSILLYSSHYEYSRESVSDHLKKSLSKTLTHFYPFAGRVKDDLTVDCNDEGVTFVEAQLSCNMDFVLENRDSVKILQNLSQRQQYVHGGLTNIDSELVIIQVSYFACGGVAINACISHTVADATAISSFLKTWAAIGRGADKVECVIYDCSPMFPPKNLSASYKALSFFYNKTHVESPDKVVEKMFVFDGSKITALREETREIANNSFCPTRVEAVTGLIWEALISATAGVSPILAVSNAVNLRSRMNPPLPQCIGNVIYLAIATAPREMANHTVLSRKIHDSIKEFSDEYIRKVFMDADGLNKLVMKMIEEVGRNPNSGIFLFSSWCRMPFYETDFGWGKPIWFGTGCILNRTGVLVDTSDGEGIEVRISLTKEEMAKFEQHPGIVAYSTFKPNV